MESSDLDVFRIQPGDVLTPTQPKGKRGGLPRRKQSDWFVKGPIPGAWLAAAGMLPGRALNVALAVWHETQLNRSAAVRVSRAAAARFGAGRNAFRNGLTKLEEAGLIAVDRIPGRSPRVIIVGLASP